MGSRVKHPADREALLAILAAAGRTASQV